MDERNDYNSIPLQHMKTAMQELMQWMEKNEFMVNKGFIEKLNECLEKEKEQICNAYTDGLEGPYVGAEEYYNKTFNQEPKKEYQPSEKYLTKQKELMEDFIWNKM